MNNEENNAVEIPEMTPEEFHAYNVLQTLIVLLDNLYCTIFVVCITFLTWKIGNWKLMWFYLLPVIAYLAV